jgi:hypothetical protein
MDCAPDQVRVGTAEDVDAVSSVGQGSFTTRGEADDVVLDDVPIALIIRDRDALLDTPAAELLGITSTTLASSIKTLGLSHWPAGIGRPHAEVDREGLLLEREPSVAVLTPAAAEFSSSGTNSSLSPRTRQAGTLLVAKPRSP